MQKKIAPEAQYIFTKANYRLTMDDFRFIKSLEIDYKDRNVQIKNLRDRRLFWELDWLYTAYKQDRLVNEKVYSNIISKLDA